MNRFVGQARVSFPEATLQRYVAALGGRLELVAAFGDKKIILTGTTAGGSLRSRSTTASRF